MTSGNEHQSAFLARFLKEQDALRATAMACCGDPHLADDIFQETALACWRSFATYDPARSFRAWARGVMRNQLANHWRRQPDGVRLLPEHLLDALIDAEQQHDQADDWRLHRLQHCLQRLGPKARDLLRLRYHGQLSREAIAERLAASVAAVKKGLTRARSALARCIEDGRVDDQRTGA